MKRTNPLLIIFATGTIFGVSPMLFPTFTDCVPFPVIHSQTGSAIRQTATAHMIYLGDYDEIHPAVQDQSSYRNVLSLYTGRSVNSLTQNPDYHVDIVYNTNLANVADSAILEPEETITHSTSMAEEKDGPITHSFAAFADGIVQKYDIQDWPAARKSLDWQFPRTSTDFP